MSEYLQGSALAPILFLPINNDPPLHSLQRYTLLCLENQYVQEFILLLSIILSCSSKSTSLSNKSKAVG